MKRAMLSFGVGPHAELLEIARPSFERFANAHNYELLLDSPDPSGRPPSWDKVPLILDALNRYDEVLWIGADCVIVNSHADISVPPGYWHALVCHKTLHDGEVPNADFWLVRQPMRPVLEEMWASGRHINSPWWEQSHLVEIMGGDADSRPVVWYEATELYERTFFLDATWNWHVNDAKKVENPRVRHATMLSDRASAMREWAEQAG